MTKYDVTIYETYVRHVYVDADSEQEAKNTVKPKYRNGEIEVCKPECFNDYGIYVSESHYF